MFRVRHVLIGLASSTALYSSFAPALGLGEITLHSALNQPLEAEIQLLQVGDLNANEIKVKLASAEAFSRSGVERFAFYNDLRFTPVLSGGRNIVRVTSRQAVREPYLNFIVEVSRPNGQLLREYTMLIDPPTTSAYGSAAPAPSSQNSSRSAPTVAASSAPPVRPKTPAVMPAATLGQTHTVRGGDTLWKIAAQLRNQGSNASQQSLMNDIYALNPQAFANDDINRLKAGVDLRLPDSAVDTRQADSSANSSSNQSAADVNQAPAVSGSASSSDSAATIPDATDDPADAAALAQIQQRLDLELANQSNLSLQLQQSISQLQAQVEALQTQVEAKDQQLADLQSQLNAGAEQQASDQPQVATPVSVEPVEQPTDWMRYLYGLLALLLAGLLALLWRSKREQTPAPEAPAVVVARPQESQPAEPLFQPVTPVLVPSPEPASVTAGQEMPVDAIEAANIYITYGRYPEAVSALRKALQAHPERHDIRFRLLEVLALQGDAQSFQAEEQVLRQSNFASERIDQLKARYPQLHVEELDFDALELDELDEPADLASMPSATDDYQLNLDDLSLDADWDLVSPFSPKTKAKPAKPGAVDIDTNLRDLPGLEELPNDYDEFAALTAENDAALGAWFNDDPRSPVNVTNLSDISANASNMRKLNQALAYIDQGSIESACDILNEVLNEGDDKQKQEARKLLAKIA